MRWLITLICSSTTGIRRAKPLCSRTSRVSSSNFASVTAYPLPLLMSTPSRVTAPVMRATTISVISSPPHRSIKSTLMDVAQRRPSCQLYWLKLGVPK